MSQKLQQALVRLLGRKFLIVAGMLASTHIMLACAQRKMEMAVLDHYE